MEEWIIKEKFNGRKDCKKVKLLNGRMDCKEENCLMEEWILKENFNGRMDSEGKI